MLLLINILYISISIIKSIAKLVFIDFLEKLSTSSSPRSKRNRENVKLGHPVYSSVEGVGIGVHYVNQSWYHLLAVIISQIAM